MSIMKKFSINPCYLFIRTKERKKREREKRKEKVAQDCIFITLAIIPHIR